MTKVKSKENMIEESKIEETSPTQGAEEPAPTLDSYFLENTKDSFTLRVKGGDPKSPDASKHPTDPIGLSRSILHVFEENPDGYCKLTSVGSSALNSAMAAFRLASIAYSARTKGTVLVATQSEYTAIVAGNKTRGICTRIFPIPVSAQL